MMKQKNIHGILSITLAVLIVFSLINIPFFKVRAYGEDEEKTVSYSSADNSKKIEEFVTRCYKVAFNRKPEKKGFNDWKKKLSNNEVCGTYVAYAFIFSTEYTQKNKSDAAFVEDLYQMFFGRASDSSGKANWTKKLKNGISREDVFAGFANSSEFYTLCEKNGITAGYWAKGYDPSKLNSVNLFVARLYNVCLGRMPEQSGQKDWVSKLLKNKITGCQIAHDFIFSKEYTDKKLSKAKYVKNLYKALMNREFDEPGYKDWINKLQSGMTRDEVFEGFVLSPEFDKICKKYGITTGTYKATKTGTYKPFVSEFKRPDQLTSLTGEPLSTNKLSDKFGNKFEFAYLNQNKSSSSSDRFGYKYSVNEKYQNLKGTIYIPEGETTTLRTNLKIYGEDKDGNIFLVYNSPQMNRDSAPVKFDVNITGFNTVSIEWGANSASRAISDLKCCLGDCYFYTVEKSEKTDRKTLPVPLIKLKNTSGYNYSVGYVGFSDVKGNDYCLGIFNNGRDQSGRIHIKYNLDQKYSKFTCVVCPIKNSQYTGFYQAYVYKDGVLAYTSPEMTITSEPVNVLVDTADCKEIEISFSAYYNPSFASRDKGL
ncbi:MAG: DUF4214 domain-containing protein, partial [Lachnospiraceae bacterium]|nr:DUF4214 domain-containing protein [Lachnospiraceae bacterium]